MNQQCGQVHVDGHEASAAGSPTNLSSVVEHESHSAFCLGDLSGPATNEAGKRLTDHNCNAAGKVRIMRMPRFYQRSALWTMHQALQSYPVLDAMTTMLQHTLQLSPPFGSYGS